MRRLWQQQRFEPLSLQPAGARVKPTPAGLGGEATTAVPVQRRAAFSAATRRRVAGWVAGWVAVWAGWAGWVAGWVPPGYM